jgi:uncharacterized protein (DUF1501 family)
MNRSPYIVTRRKFLLGSGALAASSALGMLENMGLMRAFAQAAPASDYKALVCVFLFGGNDANNMIIPRDNAGYSQYAAARGGSGGLAIAQSSLVPIDPKSLATGYGMHPQLQPLKTVWDAGKLAVLCNVGTLVEPLSKADYTSGAKVKPEQLFSHSDQQMQWQASISNDFSHTGWGGRLADVIGKVNGANTLPMIASIGGASLFSAGLTPRVIALPVSGSFGLSGFTSSTASQSRLKALKDILLLDSSSELVRAADDVMAQAIDASSIINPVITSTTSSITSVFANARNNLGNQLLQVAKLIEARAALGLKRQIFFVSLGGFDTHNNEINTHDQLYGQLGPALQAFYDATVQLGVAEQVATFTLSDFGRTLKAASGGGSDHAWGNHHLIMGGAVKGGDFYGRFPSLVLGGPDDVSNEGRWLPTTSVDQYAATLATWLGVGASDLSTVVPNIGRFAASNLGFLS